MAQQRISISRATTVLEVLEAIASLGFKGITPNNGDIVEGRVVFGRAQAFPTETPNGTKGVYRLSTNIVHDMAGFKTAFAAFKATPFSDVIACQKAWYELADKYICRANVWDDNQDLNKLRLGGEFLGRLSLETFERTMPNGAKVPATAWTVNGIISAGIKTANATAFTLEDSAPAGTVVGATPGVPGAPVLAGGPPPVGLNPNQTRMYQGTAYTVASLRSSGWTDADIEQNTTL